MNVIILAVFHFKITPAVWAIKVTSSLLEKTGTNSSVDLQDGGKK